MLSKLQFQEDTSLYKEYRKILS